RQSEPLFLLFPRSARAVLQRTDNRRASSAGCQLITEAFNRAAVLQHQLVALTPSLHAELRRELAGVWLGCCIGSILLHLGHCPGSGPLPFREQLLSEAIGHHPDVVCSASARCTVVRRHPRSRCFG